ncbi:MAG: UDP-2,3-diacylglucosamine diphosphatase [Flavobacteriales bacterium]|nr:UDP-2,3-diacylglucosamine diphosphatase [Flavobacteriales bacterium]
MKTGKKIYFASDFHLGLPNAKKSREREKQIIDWLEDISKDATEIYLLGDLFDFWFEYKKAVPKGFVRFQAKLAELCDRGIEIHVFTGNHDMWMFNYFEGELGVKMHRNPIKKEWNGKKFLLGHGDGLGPGDLKYKFIKKVFANPLCIWLFGWIHPDIGMGMANSWSGNSHKANNKKDESYHGDENEWLLQYCKMKLKTEHTHYFIFGHRHIPLNLEVGKNSRYINLGAWFSEPHYAVFDGNELLLKKVII